MKGMFRSLAIYFILFLGVLAFVTFFTKPPSTTNKIMFSDLLNYLDQNEIKTLTIEGNSVTGQLHDETIFKTFVPDNLLPILNTRITYPNGEMNILAIEKPVNLGILEIIPIVTTILMLVVLIGYFFSKGDGGGTSVMNFGKNKAKINKDEAIKLRFDDVAGLKEEKEEMFEIVDFLKNPAKYSNLGARIPKGVLLFGPPGTGKTYISKAVAGEAGVPFFAISGSDFVEMFVGVGAARVRDLFAEAKKNSPCIVFIDEIDAVGRKRGAGLGGGNDEREQTLNQLLVEMDGFTGNTGIIVMAATNRPDILDPALLRPGRFDRQITIQEPDVREREQVLKVHAKNKPISDDVDFSIVAKSTPGFSPADLENVLNEAALLAARNNEVVISLDDIKKSITKVIAGVEKKSAVVSEKNRKLVAYHEAGHAVVARLLPDADPVHQVTIIPRGRAGGFTLQIPDEENHYQTKKSLEREIIILLGGRVAEQIVLGDISTGASNDLKRIAKIAKAMVEKYAMSDTLGAMCYSDENELYIGRDFGAAKSYSDSVASEIDLAVRKIVDDAYSETYRLLTENIDKLHTVAESLIKYETITGNEFEVAFSEGLEALDKLIESEKEKSAKLKEAGRQKYEAEKREKEQKRQENIDKINEQMEILMAAASGDLESFSDEDLLKMKNEFEEILSDESLFDKNLVNGAEEKPDTVSGVDVDSSGNISTDENDDNSSKGNLS